MTNGNHEGNNHWSPCHVTKQYERGGTIKTIISIRTISPDTHIQPQSILFTKSSYIALMEVEINARQIQVSVEIFFLYDHKQPVFTRPVLSTHLGCWNALFFPANPRNHCRFTWILGVLSYSCEIMQKPECTKGIKALEAVDVQARIFVSFEKQFILPFVQDIQ